MASEGEEESMSTITRGFHGRRRDDDGRLPPGQYLTGDFPVLSAGPTPRISLQDWTFTVRTDLGQVHRWSWPELVALPAETVTVDIHCVTRWTKLDTTWHGVSLDTLLADVETAADFALVHSYGGYTTNLPLEDLLDGKAWVAFEYEGDELAPEHGGPARLLVPHLYFWKSAKWVSGLDLVLQDEPGFWEQLGYHDYGDPWREQRYQGD
jgi:DMSO/TMAO reductase YedYZ molybdopterin-dependent catalytic subunit